MNDAVLSPPWHLGVRAVGHTFVSEQFAPQLSMGNGRPLTFPGTHVGDRTYQTVKLTNRSNLPAQFAFERDPTGTFTCKPANGMILSEGFQVGVMLWHGMS